MDERKDGAPVQDQIPDGVVIDPARRKHTAAVTLRQAVKHGERTLATVELGPLTAAHVRRAPPSGFQDGPEGSGGTERVLEFSGQLSGLPPSVLDQLVGEDLGNVVVRTLEVSWPMLDLPAQWEALWAREREEGGEGGRLPSVRGGYALELQAPLRGDRDTVTRLEFHEVTGKLARRFPIGGLPVSRLPWLIEELTGVPGPVVDLLQGQDLHRALALAQCFFLAIRGTTATSG